MSKTRPRPTGEWYAVEYEGEQWFFDIPFLVSRWSCAFGNGCKGIDGNPDHGCCAHGAAVDDESRNTLNRFVPMLSPETWNAHDQVRHRSDWGSRSSFAGGAQVLAKDHNEGGWGTRTDVTGICIFQNLPGGRAAPGCALHVMALENGIDPDKVKPNPCRDLPVHVYRDTDGDVVVTRWTTEETWAVDWLCTGDRDYAFWSAPGEEMVFTTLDSTFRRHVPHPLWEHVVRYLKTSNPKTRPSMPMTLPIVGVT